MSGKSFCPAAKDAFMLILRNPATFTTIASLSFLYILIGQLLVGGLTTAFGYYMTPAGVIVEYPCVFYAIIGFLIGTIFMNLFVKASDATVVVYLIDHEISKVHMGKGGASNQ